MTISTRTHNAVQFQLEMLLQQLVKIPKPEYSDRLVALSLCARFTYSTMFGIHVEFRLFSAENGSNGRRLHVFGQIEFYFLLFQLNLSENN